MTETDKQPRILLIDDDRFLLDMYSLKFKKSGLEIETSSSTARALEKIRSGKTYDIMLLDIVMPGMDGLEFLETVRKEGLVKETVIIMLTNQQEDYQKAQALEVDGYIIKATMIPSEVVEYVLKTYKDKKKS